MKRVYSLLILAMLSQPLLYAQSDWKEKPAYHTISEEYKKESMVMILDERTLRLEWDEKEKEMMQYRGVHRIVRLQDDKGVESFNTMVIGGGRYRKVVDIKARTIKSNGKVIELAKDQLKTSKNEYDNIEYHVAFENVNTGDEIEYFFEERSPFVPFGSEQMQFGIPVIESRFVLSSPSRLVFDCKGYNGFPSATLSENDETKTYTTTMKHVDAIKDETYSDADIHSKRIDYKLSYVADNASRLYTWTDLVKRLYDMLYKNTDKENKAIQKYVKGLSLSADLPEEELIKKLELAIKKDIILNDELFDPAYDKLDFILEKKTTHERGMMKIFTACLDALGVKYEAGFTANRFKYIVDEQLENWNYLDIYIIYFPKSKKYLLPTAPFFRYPAIGPFVEGSKAVFCKRVSAGDVTSAVSVIREIPVSTLKENWSKLQANVSFSKEDFTPNVHFDYSFSGSSAIGVRESIALSTKENEKEIVKSLLHVADQEQDIKSYSFVNRGLEYYSDNKAVGVVSEIAAGNLLEKAGNKYLFKIGDVIGPQVEMYQDEKRVLPIAIEFPHVLYREIIINIPEGYKITNPQVVDKDVFYGDDSFGFVSSHKIEGNKLIVSIKEHYAKISYDKSEIEPFRKVINAAADFNKVTLVFEKI